jgi:hypothetical protein
MRFTSPNMRLQLAEWISAGCPACGAQEIYNQDNDVICGYCGFTLVARVLTSEDGEFIKLFNQYFALRRHLESAQRKLVNWTKAGILRKKTDSIKRNEFLEIHYEQRKKEVYGTLFFILFGIVTLIGLCSAALSMETGNGLLFLVIVFILVMTLPGMLWRKLRDFLMRKKIAAIRSKYADEFEDAERDFLGRQRDLEQAVESYKREIDRLHALLPGLKSSI